MSELSDTHHKKVEISCKSVIFRTIRADFRSACGAVREMDVLLLKIHKVDEFLVEAGVAAGLFNSVARIVFVYAEKFHVLE